MFAAIHPEIIKQPAQRASGGKSQMCLVLAVALMALAVSGCTPPQPRYTIDESPGGGSAARDADQPSRVYKAGEAFSVVPPKGYVPENPGRSFLLAFVGPRVDGFGINFNVHRERGSVAASPDKAKSILRWLLRDYRPLEEGYAIIDGRACYWLSGTFRWQGRMVRCLQYFLASHDGDDLYVLTYAAPVEAFDAHRRTFEDSALTARAD